MKIVVVESPAKAKTIKKYLGKGYEVLASYGHVRDLLAKEGSVDTANQFAMTYAPIERNSGHVQAICKALKQANGICLATDPDREGEAIAWHLVEMLNKKKMLKDKSVERIYFYQITKNAIQEAIQQPRDLSMDLVNAQQARRALDFLVGFTLSPLLWRKVKAGLSAGRVQTPALRLIVEREEEIKAFEPKEYWTVHGTQLIKDCEFKSRLTQYQGNKVEQFSFQTEQEATDCVNQIIADANGQFKVAKIVKKQRQRKPLPPLITSSLQQEAVRRLGFTTQNTMRVAQQLYEGIELPGEGAVGLITYMRTDSVHLATEAVESIRAYIDKNHPNALPNDIQIYQNKSKNAQEAHEAIRPTDVMRDPESLKSVLDKYQFKLYQLVWQRTVACQMKPALLDTVSIDLSAKDHIMRANGSVMVDPGFLAVYADKMDSKTEDRILPPMEQGQMVDINKIWPEQHFTEPPPRYSEASLVKTLEEYDIGRPSTYASIINTLKQRNYVEMDKKRFIPTDIAMVVCGFLKKYFSRYVDYHFTAQLEDQLDRVALGKEAWVPLLESFWNPFKGTVDDVDKNVKRSDVTKEIIDEKCPECQASLSIQLGKRGRFIGCTGYPDCSYTRSMEHSSEDDNLVKDRLCPQCQSKLVVKHGPYGKFIGCSSYPDCRFIESLFKPEDTKVSCPQCHQGSLLSRRSRKGKIFYSCSRYPDCDYALWNMPIDDKCQKCAWPILSIKETKRFGKQVVCPQKDCSYKRDLTEED